MILVTGGTGLVGSHLLYHLVKDGEKVRAIFRSEDSLVKVRAVLRSYKAESAMDKIEWVKADVTDYFSLKDCFEGVEKVYHAAAVVSFDKAHYEELMQVNVEGTRLLVNLCLEFPVQKLCYVSSVAALGEYPDKRCIDEEAPWQFDDHTSYYSVSKYYAENEVWRASEEGLDVVIVNPSTIIGFAAAYDGSSSIIYRVKKGLNYYTTGSNGFIGVNDVVKAMLQLMNSNVVNQRFILVSENLTFQQLLTTIAEGLEKRAPTKKASKLLAHLLLLVYKIKAFLSGGSAKISKEALAVAYGNKCYSSERISKELNFRFQPMNEVIAEATSHYLQFS
jgi:nucleoside-diphosphate-sugar epimerase